MFRISAENFFLPRDPASFNWFNLILKKVSLMKDFEIESLSTWYIFLRNSKKSKKIDKKQHFILVFVYFMTLVC